MDMSTRKIRWFILMFLIAISAILFSQLPAAHSEPGQAEEPGLGYSEAPFELIENAETVATGPTALEAVQAASAGTEPIALERIVVEDNYALMSVTYNYIGISAITKRQGSSWQFVCRAGGLMAPEELTDRCGVPSATAESLYNSFLEASSR
jgi:hypothetical protein